MFRTHDAAESSFRSLIIQKRVRLFTDTSGAAPTAIETHLENEINNWLVATAGTFLSATQSESRGEELSHLTVAVWYRAEEKASPDAQAVPMSHRIGASLIVAAGRVSDQVEKLGDVEGFVADSLRAVS